MIGRFRVTGWSRVTVHNDEDIRSYILARDEGTARNAGRNMGR